MSPTPQLSLRNQAIALAAILLLAAVLRGSGLSTLPLWIDEQFTLNFAKLSLSEIIRTGNTAHPPGFPLLAHFPLRWTDQTWGIRIPAVVGGLAGIGVIFAGLRGLGFSNRAPFGALFLSCSVYHVYFSQEARGYTCMSSLVGLASVATVCYFQQRTKLLLGLVLLSSIVASAFHYLAIPSCAVLLAILLGDVLSQWLRGRRGTVGPVSMVLLLLAVGSGLLLAGFFLRARLDSVLDHLTTASSTRVSLSPQSISGALGRWSGLGVFGGWYASASVTIGLIVAVRANRKAALVLLAVIVAPFVTVALMPWPVRFELRYLMAAMIPSMMLLVIGVGWQAELMGRLWSTHAPGKPAQILPAVAFLLIAAVQLRAVVEHKQQGIKFNPALESTAFGCEHILMHSRLETHLVRSVSTEDFRTTRKRLGPLVLPLPTWPLVALARDGTDGPFEFRLSNPMADDVLILRVSLPEGPRDPAVRAQEAANAPAAPTRSRSTTEVTEQRNPLTDQRVAFTRLEGEFQGTGVGYQMDFLSSRLDLVDQYFEEIQRSVRLNRKVLQGR